MTPDLADPDRILALAYAQPSSREALRALWALDETLGRIVATTSQPMIGHMRLTWWHERLAALDRAEVPAEPLLAALADLVRRHDVTGAAMARLVEGWEILLDSMPRDEDLVQFADARGAGLFALSATLLESSCDDAAGQAWALADFARRCSDRALAERARALAPRRASGDRMAKPLRMLAWFAHHDLARPRDQPRSRWTPLRAALA